VFSKGRDFGARLRLVTKQNLDARDRTILGSISKRGNRYLRALLIQAAWVVRVNLGSKHRERYGHQERHHRQGRRRVGTRNLD
jgi:transposase